VLQPTVAIGPGQRAVGISATPDGQGIWVATSSTTTTTARPGSASFALLHPTARWNACAGAITWRYDPFGAPPGATVEFFQAGFDYVSQVTGFAFSYGGVGNLDDDIADQSIIVGWDLLDSGVLGIGGAFRNRSRYVAGGLALNAGLREPFGWADGWGPVFLHEMGHVLGLDHVDDTNQLMYPSTSPVSTFGDGDLAGLWTVGPAQGCAR
jgi:hypothetical protein